MNSVVTKRGSLSSSRRLRPLHVLTLFLVSAFGIMAFHPPVAAQSRVDLMVDSVQVEAPRLASNQKVVISALIRNNGSEPTGNVYLEVQIHKFGKVIKTLKEIPVLSQLPRASTSKAVPIYVEGLAPGVYEAVVIADPDDLILETDESNNKREKLFTIGSPIA